MTSVAVAGPRSFPIIIENLFLDTIRGLRPKFVFASSAGQANDLVQQLVQELQAKMAHIRLVYTAAVV